MEQINVIQREIIAAEMAADGLLRKLTEQQQIALFEKPIQEWDQELLEKAAPYMD